MTAEKRRKMQMYKKQAYIAEVRLKSRSREKDFFNKIQGALDEVRASYVADEVFFNSKSLKFCYKYETVLIKYHMKIKTHIEVLLVKKKINFCSN